MAMEQTWTRAALWTLLEKITSLIVQLVVFLLLARMLGPASFGVFNAVFIVFAVATIVFDSGFQIALVRGRDVEGGLVHTVFWTMLGCAVAYVAVVTAVIVAVAGMIDNQEVVSVVLWMLPLIVVYPIVTTLTALLKRRLLFRALAVRPLIANGLAGAAGIAAAAYGDMGVYSLVLREYVMLAIQIALSIGIVGWRPRLHFRREELASVTTFVRHASAHGLMHTLGNRIPAPIIAGSLGIVPAGYYGAASRLGDLVFTLARFTMSRVGLQAFSHGEPSIEEVRRMYRYAVRLVALVTVPMFCGLSLVAEPLVATLLDDQWLPVTGLLAILSLGYLPLCFASLNRTLMFARGRARWVAWETAIGLAAAVVGVWLAVPYGLEAVGWAIAGRNLLVLAISTAGVLRYFKLPPVLLAGAVLRPALAAVAMVAAILALEHTELTDGDSLRGLAILVAGGAVAYGIAVLALMPREIVALASRLRSAFRPAAAG